MEKIKIAIIGIGNCASSLIQGIEYYRTKSPEDAIGIMHWDIGGFKPHDIEVVAAFDVDERKVGQDVSKAIFLRLTAPRSFAQIFPTVASKSLWVKSWMAFLSI